jgi:hypothetical protein
VEKTWTYQVEQEKLLPVLTYEDRVKLLQTPEGAIQYIGAAMDLIALIYERGGSPGVVTPSMRSNPVMLTQVYQGSSPEDWAKRVATIKAGEVLKPGNSMALWLFIPRNMSLIEDGVDDPLPDLTAKCVDRDVTAEEGAQILKAAREYLNAPYSYGGNTKAGIDCSHLVYRAIVGAFPKSGYAYLDTSHIPTSKQIHKLAKEDRLQAGDLILFGGHVGFYDPTPPTDKPGQTLFSARGSQSVSTPGVTWGKSEWFQPFVGNYRLRLSCD